MSRVRVPLLLLSFVVFAALHAVRVPMFEGPDEPQNFQYLDFIATEGKLVTPTTELTHEMENLGRGIMPPLWFLVHLPVYHAWNMGAFEPAPVLNPEFLRHPDALASFAERGLDLEQALALPNGRLHYLHGLDEGATPSPAAAHAIGALEVLRLTSVFWGALALWFTYLAFVQVLACRGRAFWFTALFAWTPQFQFISANINMDAMLAAAGAFFFYATARWLRAERAGSTWALLAGLAVGVAATVKLNGLVLGLPLGLAALLRLRARGAGARPVAEGLLAAAACAASLAPYYLYGFIKSGHPLWMWAYQKASPLHNPPGQVEAVWDLTGLWNYHLGLFLTWFADIGWASVWFPHWITLTVMLVFGLGSAFGLVWIVRGLQTGRGQSAGGALFLGAFVAIFAAEFYFNSSIPQPQGRHLYPFLPVILFPLGIGLERAWLLKPFALVCLVLSVAAFPLLVGKLRPPGWNARAWVAVTDAGRIPARDSERSAEPTVAWSSASLAPGGGLRADLSSGLLQWEARPDHTYELLLAVNNPLFEERPWNPGQLLVRSSVAFGTPLAGVAQLPADLAQTLPEGAHLAFQVVELDSEGRMSGFSPVLTTGP